MSQNSIHHSLKSEIKNTLSLGIPFIAAQLIYACSGFIGIVMVARLGEDALAASILVLTIWMSLFVFFFGILSSICVLVAHQYGARNYQAISEIMGQSFLFGMIICIPMSVILFALPFFLQWSHQPPQVLNLALEYMRALLWTIPGLVALVILEQFLIGIGRTKLALRISLLVVPVEIVLMYVLIFGKVGLPVCGIAGIGYGLAVTNTGTAAVLIAYLLKSKYYQQYGIFRQIFQINKRYLKECLRIGLPMGLMHLIECSTFAVATLWIARFGTDILAAHQIVMQYFHLCVPVVFAMSQTVTVRVGHAIGRQDVSGVRYAIYAGMLLTFFGALCLAIAFISVPQLFLAIDINLADANNAELIRNASLLLSIFSVLFLWDNCRIVIFGALRGLKDTRFAMYSSLIGFWAIGLTTAFLLSFVFDFKGPGIWWGLTAGIMSGAIILIARLQYRLKRIDLKKIMKIF